MKKLHITINNFKDTPITTSQWVIQGEPERVAVRFGNKEYVTVLDNPVYYEIWSLDNEGELFELEETIYPEEKLTFSAPKNEVKLLEKIFFWNHND